MQAKTALKTKAAALRKQGLSYSEILAQIPVAKSTLSLWLRDVGLAKRQARKDARVRATELIMREVAKDIGAISRRELFLMGVMSYWAEGAKEKEYRPSADIQFSNSDADMVRLFLRWLDNILQVSKQDVYFDLYVHINHKHRITEIIQFWADKTSYPTAYFTHVYFKKHSPKTNRFNIGPTYYGLVKVRVRASTSLARRIAGWTSGVIEWVDS